MDSITNLLGMSIPYELIDSPIYETLLVFQYLFRGVLGLMIINGMLNLFSSWSVYFGSGRILK